MVEVMKAYRRNSQVIAFDEPTAPLTDKEIDILFKLIRQLKEEGKIVLYVSHRLNEIFKVTDDIVVLKDGRQVKSFVTAETNERELIKAMVGRDIGDTYANLKRNDKFGDVLLEVDKLNTHVISDISFKLRKGEIVGFAGLVGAGRTEVARGYFRSRPDCVGRNQDRRKTGPYPVSEGSHRQRYRALPRRQKRAGPDPLALRQGQYLHAGPRQAEKGPLYR